MNKRNLLSIAGILLTFEVVTCVQPFIDASPYDFVDDAKAQLESLRSIVSGTILVAMDDLDNFHSGIKSYGNDVQVNGNVSINLVYTRVAEDLQQIKDLAAQANKDISRCTGGREQMIHQLPDELKGRIKTCVGVQLDDGAGLIDAENYLVDIVMTRVQHMEFQMQICGDSVLCLTPVLNQIEKDIIELPLQIKEEVKKAEELIGEMTGIMKECYDNNLADFTGYVVDLVEQISTCASGIIGRG